MAQRHGGATRGAAVELYRPPGTEPVELPDIDRDAAEGAVDREAGTSIDWLGQNHWSTMFDEDNLIVGPSERTWVADVKRMLNRGGQPRAVDKALTLPLQQANLTIETPEGDKGEAEFVRDVLYSAGQSQGMKPDLVGIVAQMTAAIAFKRSYHELVFARRKDGRIGYGKVAWRPPESCEPILDRVHGEMRGFRQYVSSGLYGELHAKGREVYDLSDDLSTQDYGYVTIPATRAMIYTHGQDRDPVNGISDLNVTYWAHTLQQKILMLWAVYLDGASLPRVLAYGDTQPEAKKNAQMIATLRGSGVLGIKRNMSNPEQKVFETLDASGNGAGEFLNMITYLDQQMTRSIMAGFLDLTSGATRGSGSYALSADQSGLFLNSRQSTAKELAATATDQLIAPLIRINFGSDRPIPRLVFEKMSADQNDKALQLLQQLGSAQNLQVPAGFLELLVERVAQFLDLSDEKVEKLLEAHAEQQKQQAELMGRAQEASVTAQGQLTDKVNGAEQLLKQATTGQGLAPKPVGPLPVAAAAAGQRRQEKQ